MDRIDFQHRTRLVFAPAAIERLGELAKELGAQRALVVSDQGVVAAGHFARGVHALEQSGVEVTPFLGVRENPSTDDVEAGVAIARNCKPQLLVGLGGGSSMDCAKGINFIYSCGGKMEDYWGVGKATADMLPMIAVPTTAGTGSEAQSFALISHATTHAKMACGDIRAACRIALLDPELTVTQPPRVTALTGIDAISHAVETYVTKPRNPLSLCYSREAWRLLSRGFPEVLASPTNLQARGQVQLGAYFAGLAIETSMLGAAHALANPLTAKHGIAHGQAVGMMLPRVVNFNGKLMDHAYADLWRDVEHTGQESLTRGGPASELLANYLMELTQLAGLATDLGALGIAEDEIDTLAEQAQLQWTGKFNPRELSRDDFRNLYATAFTTQVQ